MTARPLALAALVALATLATLPAARAWAQPGPSTRAQAASHFRQGQAFFQHEDYDRAITEYQAAFDLSAEPSLIFNIALCHDRMGRPEPALQAFQRYLELAPGGSVADEARNDVARLTPVVARLAAERAEQEVRLREEAARRREAAAKAAAARQHEEEIAHRIRLGYYVMGAGALFTAAGATAHTLAWQTRDRMMHEPGPDDYFADRHAFEIQRGVAIGGYAAGALALATGLVLVLTARDPSEGPRVSAAIMPGGAAMVIEWTR